MLLAWAPRRLDVGCCVRRPLREACCIRRERETEKRKGWGGRAEIGARCVRPRCCPAQRVPVSSGSHAHGLFVCLFGGERGRHRLDGRASGLSGRRVAEGAAARRLQSRASSSPARPCAARARAGRRTLCSLSLPSLASPTAPPHSHTPAAPLPAAASAPRWLAAGGGAPRGSALPAAGRPESCSLSPSCPPPRAPCACSQPAFPLPPCASPCYRINRVSARCGVPLRAGGGGGRLVPAFLACCWNSAV